WPGRRAAWCWRWTGIRCTWPWPAPTPRRAAWPGGSGPGPATCATPRWTAARPCSSTRPGATAAAAWRPVPASRRWTGAWAWPGGCRWWRSRRRPGLPSRTCPAAGRPSSSPPAGAAGEAGAVRPPGEYLLDPSPAVTRAGLVRDLAVLTGGRQIDDQIAFLSADVPLVSPFGRSLRVLDSGPWNQKQLPGRLRAAG